jgi:hypothetical protein
MRISKFWLIVVLILALLVFTNPSKDQHTDALLTELSRKSNEKILNEGDGAYLLGAALGTSIAENFTKNFVDYDSFLILSISKIEREGNTTIISYGVLGNIFFTSKAQEAFKLQ